MLVIPNEHIKVTGTGKIPVGDKRVPGIQVIAQLPDSTGKKLIPTTKYLVPVDTRPYGSDAHTHRDKQGIGYNVPGFKVATPRAKVEKPVEVEVAEIASAPPG